MQTRLRWIKPGLWAQPFHSLCLEYICWYIRRVIHMAAYVYKESVSYCWNVWFCCLTLDGFWYIPHYGLWLSRIIAVKSHNMKCTWSHLVSGSEVKHFSNMTQLVIWGLQVGAILHGWRVRKGLWSWCISWILEETFIYF